MEISVEKEQLAQFLVDMDDKQFAERIYAVDNNTFTALKKAFGFQQEITDEEREAIGEDAVDKEKEKDPAKQFHSIITLLDRAKEDFEKNDGKVFTSVKELNEIYLAQILTYLKLSECKLGLLINFNVLLLKDGIKRVIND